MRTLAMTCRRGSDPLRLASVAWRALGREATVRLLDLVEPVGDRLVERIDATAGPKWMPAARSRVTGRPDSGADR